MSTLVDEKLKSVLTGHLGDLTVTPANTVKIYVCCINSDFQHEREILWNDVLPELQQHFLQYGLEIVLDDPHLGMLSDQVFDRYQFDARINDITDCSHMPLGPFVLCLIGNKYGPVPLPGYLEEVEYTVIKEEAFEAGKDVKLLDEWYKPVEKAVPPIYKLQPVTAQFQHYYSRDSATKQHQERDVAEWLEVFSKLQDLIQYGAKLAHSEGRINQVHPHKQQRFFSSALEQECQIAMQKSTRNCLVIMRTFTGIDVTQSVASDFTDVQNTALLDNSAQKKLKDLQEKVAETFNEDNKHSLYIPWHNKGLFPSACEEHKDYLDNFHAVAAIKLKKLIEKQLKANLSQHHSDNLKFKQSDYSECLSHLLHLRQFSGGSLHGFDSICERVRSLIIKSLKGGEHQMVLLYGTEGCGKTALLSKIGQISLEMLGKETVLVIRYLGLTEASSSVYSVLKSICSQVSCILKQDMKSDLYSFEQLASYYNDLLKLISKGNRHLVVILDNLEALMSTWQSEDLLKLEWLTQKLSLKVHIFASFLTGMQHSTTIFNKLKSKLNSKEFLIEIPPLTDGSSKLIAMDIISESQNKYLQSVEHEKVLTNILQQISSPLTVSLFIDSFMLQTQSNFHNSFELPVVLEKVINQKFESLEERHGAFLIAQTSRYLLASREGLTEMELLDLLSCNDVVINKCYQAKLPSIVRFPSTLWLQMRRDFGMILDWKRVHDKVLLSWSHRCITLVASARYFNSTEDKKQSHRDLVEFYLETWVHSKPLIRNDGTERQVLEGVVRHVSQQPLLFSDRCYNYRRLSEILHQLMHSGDIQRFKQYAVCNYEFLLARLHSTSVQTLYSDLQSTCKSVMDLELHLVLYIIQMGMSILNKEPIQLASEFIGRLRQIKEDFTASTDHLADEYSNNIESLVQQCMQWCDSYNLPLLIPLSSWLPDPRTPQVATLKCSEGIAVIQPTSNNQHIFCGTHKNTILMYHSASQKMIRAFTGHRGTVTCLKVSRNNRTVVSGSMDSVIRTWDISSGKCTNTFKGHNDAVLCLCVTSNDDLVISGSKDKTFRVWSISQGKQIHSISEHKAAVTCMTLNSTDIILVTGSADCSVRMWYMEDMTPLSVITGSQTPITCLALSLDNTFLLLGCEDTSIQVKSFTTGSDVHKLQGHKTKPLCMNISRDCFHAVISCQNGSIYIYNLRTTELLNVLTGHKSSVTSLVISIDETFIFSCAKEEMVVWTMYKYFTREVHTSDHTDSITCAAIAPDGKMAITGSKDRAVKLWNLEFSDFLEDLIGHEAPITCVALANETAFAISGSQDKTVKVWSIMLGMVITDYREHRSEVTSVFIISESLQVLSAESAGVIKVWKAEDGETLLSCDGPTSIIGMAPSGQYAVSGEGGQSLKVWNVENGELVKTITHTDTVTVVAYSADCQYLITGSSDMSLKVWEAATGKITQVLVGHDGPVLCVAITESNQYIVSGSEDKQLLVWGLETGEVEHKLLGHTAPVTAVRVTSDGSTAITGSKDETLRVWSLMKGVLITVFDMHYPVCDLYITMEAAHVVVHLENQNRVPLMCLHNSPADEVKTQSQVSVVLPNENSVLPIKPRPPLLRRPSVVYPLPTKVNATVRSSVSSIPEIIKVSPIKAPLQKAVKAQESNKEKKERQSKTADGSSSNSTSQQKKTKKSSFCALL